MVAVECFLSMNATENNNDAKMKHDEADNVEENDIYIYNIVVREI